MNPNGLSNRIVKVSQTLERKKHRLITSMIVSVYLVATLELADFDIESAITL